MTMAHTHMYTSRDTHVYTCTHTYTHVHTHNAKNLMMILQAACVISVNGVYPVGSGSYFSPDVKFAIKQLIMTRSSVSKCCLLIVFFYRWGSSF